MIARRSSEDERKVEIDLSKIVPLGLIPIILLSLVLLGTNQQSNKALTRLSLSLDSIRTDTKIIKGQVDTLKNQNTAIIRVLCNRAPAKDINLTGLKCL